MKALKIILNILKYTFLGIFLLFLIVVVTQKVTNNNLSFGGVRIFTVVSGSMDPVYKIGDVLVIKSTDFENIKVGDDVCYLGEEEDFTGKVVTHRVKEVHDDKTLITEGVANVLPDPEIRYDQIYGKVAYKTILLSLLSKIATNKISFFIVIFIPILGFIIYEIYNLIKEMDKKAEKKALEEIEKDEKEN